MVGFIEGFNNLIERIKQNDSLNNQRSKESRPTNKNDTQRFTYLKTIKRQTIVDETYQERPIRIRYLLRNN